MNLYISDLHFGHKNVILFDHRPFSDVDTMDDCENAAKYLESAEKMQHVTDEDKQICLCHYPLAEWYKSRHGSWLIYGHIHGARDEVYEFMKTRERALNAGACINNYTPVSFNELVRNNKAFQEKDL